MIAKKIVRITFKVTKKPGVMSFLIRHASTMGLMFSKFKRNEGGNSFQIIIDYTGSLNISLFNASQSFEEDENVIEVQDISLFASEAEASAAPPGKKDTTEKESVTEDLSVEGNAEKEDDSEEKNTFEQSAMSRML